jgi:hypothetical protein
VISIWQVAFRIVAVVGSVSSAVLLIGEGVLWLVRRAGRNRQPRQ